jgi:hypothetical protein
MADRRWSVIEETRNATTRLWFTGLLRRVAVRLHPYVSEENNAFIFRVEIIIHVIFDICHSGLHDT